MNIASSVDRAARHFPAKEALRFEDRSWTYAELRAEVDRVAHGLVALGIGRGDRVALFLPNIPAFPIVYLAAQKVGAISVSVNTMLTAHELEYVLEDSGAETLFTVADLLPQLSGLVGDVLDPTRVVVCEGEADGFRSLEGLSDDESPFACTELDRDDQAAVLYTSGTTGKQKGAVLSHGNVVSNTNATAHALRVDPDDRLLLFLPLFHCFAQNFILNTAFVSAATVVLHRRFVPEVIVRSVREDAVTMFFGVPTVFIGLLNGNVPQEHVAGVRYFFSAAATLPVEVAQRWHEVYGMPIFEGYGLTETSPFATYNHEWQHRPGSVGTPIEMVEVCIVDTDDDPVAAGAWGEILIKGPNVMLGYWQRPGESAEALRGGWFHTGDIGYLDEDGFLFIVDRVKDMINLAGFKVWPREIEEVLYEHPAIAECAVVAMPDPVKGELPRALIVVKDGHEVTSEALEELCRERLATYKVPALFEVVSELPKSATGKILKRVLREQAPIAEPL